MMISDVGGRSEIFFGGIMSTEDKVQNIYGLNNVLNLSEFRSKKNNSELGESYSAFLGKLNVSDLFYEAKNTIDEIQRSNIDVYHLKKADRILKEISRRVLDDSPGMSDSLNSLRDEIQNQISKLIDS